MVEIGGAISRAIGGGTVKATQVAIDPDQWVTTFYRALKAYIEARVDTDIYEVISNFPQTSHFAKSQPFSKTIIHFEIDDSRNDPIGVGDNVIDLIYDDVAETVSEVQAEQHVINLDVGVWASYQSGGDTSRMRAFQELNKMFVGPKALNDCRDEASIEIRSFRGGNFAIEEINDLPVFRVMGMTLIVRVFSRTVKMPEQYITGFGFDPAIVDVDNVLIEE